MQQRDSRREWLRGHIQSELLRELNRDGKDVSECPVEPGMIAELVKLIEDGTISGKIGKDVFAKMYQSGDAPKVIVEREGLVQVTDEGAISEMIDEILAANPDKVEEFRGGKDKLLGFFVGQVMKASGGKANPQAVNKLLRDKLSG